ncbi:MAG: hypothetical protein ABIR62_01645, partial [Dokdonella sp.]|uniref:hypothetical protein n=1 Tax=Dokdonella sp. TaxID=2291710 RepID=UPI003265815E
WRMRSPILLACIETIKRVTDGAMHDGGFASALLPLDMGTRCVPHTNVHVTHGLSNPLDPSASDAHDCAMRRIALAGRGGDDWTRAAGSWSPAARVGQRVLAAVST